MFPRTPSIGLHVHNAPDALKEAFDAAWVVLQARDPFRDLDRDFELRAALNRKLKMLAAEGVTNPVELREWVLENLPRS
jgi:hypothetical protein